MESYEDLAFKPEKDTDLLEENKKLKDLLKECYTAMNEAQYWDQCRLLRIIDEVLK